VVGAAGAGELHATLDASDGVVSLHNSILASCPGKRAHVGGAAKVMGVRRGRSSEVGMGPRRFPARPVGGGWADTGRADEQNRRSFHSLGMADHLAHVPESEEV
jgi:hypothetical protein